MMVIIVIMSLTIFRTAKGTTSYMKECIAIDRKTLISNDGMMWGVKGGLEANQHYIVIFNDNGTNVIIKDDYIINIFETRN